MRFLLDENIPNRVALALRSGGHNVERVQETALRGAGDEAVWSHAAEDDRIFITADLGFPLPGPRPPGMLLIRGFERVSATTFTALLLDAVRSVGDDIVGLLIVVSPGRLRRRRF
jgi:predicted nuclease of predicted toxin-antitoxin system